MQAYLYRELYELESKHWWFVAKKEIILSLLDKYMSADKQNKILDAGCGSGLMLKSLEKYGDTYGMDYSEEAIQFSKLVFNGEIKRCSLPDQVPYGNNFFDVIVALDVLEHIEEDVESLRSLKKILKPDGMAIITVPAYMFLWSNHDEVHEHKRRYTKKELENKLEMAGLKIQKLSYYNSLLFPPIFLIRIINKIFRKDSTASDASMPSPIINKILKAIFSFEKLILAHFNMHFGVSLVAVVKNENI